MNFEEGFHGALRTIVLSDPYVDFTDLMRPFGSGFFVRNQVLYLNQYGNVDINGWDGQGIDMNEEEGTIFAATVGAGWKNALTNTFTGVLMGVDKSMKKADFSQYVEGIAGKTKDDPNWKFLEEQFEKHPYMTGLFGYQDGVQSFGILENGTAYFGRADRGGRIIFDGANATIYGGGNGLLSSPTIGDAMWNNMRLTLVDLTHTVNPTTGRVKGYWDETDAAHNAPTSVAIKGAGNTAVQQGFGGLFFEHIQDDAETSIEARVFADTHRTSGFSYTLLQDLWSTFNARIKRGATTLAKHGFSVNEMLEEKKGDKTLPIWYKYLWRLAYIKPDGQLPYWLEDTVTPTEKLYDDLMFFPAADANGANGDLSYYEARKAVYGEDSNLVERLGNRRINYYDADFYFDQDGAAFQRDPESFETAQRLSAFGPSRASTTPAIEIGQHEHGLMPGILPWDAYHTVFATLAIPGDRNFMVTYDGTLWAMNGVFMGAVIGSNIIGGRIQGAEIGVGWKTEEDTDVWRIRDTDQWSYLTAPTEYKVSTRPEEIPDNLAFYVSKAGDVVARSLAIYGGSIDIGHFHLIGKAWMTSRILEVGGSYSTDGGKTWTPFGEGQYDMYDFVNRAVYNKRYQIQFNDSVLPFVPAEENGHLIQYAHSDFIGPMHVYGSLGIGPKVLPELDPTNGQMDVVEASELGILTHTMGIVAMGVPLKPTSNEGISIYDTRTTKYHRNLVERLDEVKQLALDSKVLQSELSAVYSDAFDKWTNGVDNSPSIKKSILTEENLKSQEEFFENGTDVESSAFFGIDATTKGFPLAVTNPSTNSYIQGHMWPLFYKFGYTAKDQTPNVKSGKPFITGYVTLMDQFASNSLTLSQGDGKIEFPDLGQNYFRVGPYGVEQTQVWIRKNFQR